MQPDPITHDEVGWVPGAKRPRGGLGSAVPHGKLLRHASREQFCWRAVGILTPGRSMRGGRGPFWLSSNHR